MKKLFAVSILLMVFGVCINAQDKNTEKELKGTAETYDRDLAVNLVKEKS